MGLTNVTNDARSQFQAVTCEIKHAHISRQIERGFPRKPKFVEKITEVRDLPIYQPITEAVIRSLEQLRKLGHYSKIPQIAEIEKALKKKGVAVRFGDNIEMAELVSQGLQDIENAGYSLPHKIFVVKPKVIPGLAGFTAIFRQKTAEKAPILLSDIIPYIPANPTYSTKNPAHTLIHEVGYWLHLQVKPNNQICKAIWKTANKSQIEHEVSKESIRREDGAEFVAEVFAGLVDGKKYSKHVMDIYGKLKGPMPGKKLFINS